MEALSDRDIDIVYDALLERGLYHAELQEDLLDHTCCMIEEQMSQGCSFDVGLHKALDVFSATHLQEIQEVTEYLLTTKIRIMKRVMGITGIIASVLVIAGVVFKINHWLGANVSLVLGLVLAGLVAIPLMATIDLKTAKSQLYKATTLLGYGAATILIIATLFKIMHWPGFAVLYYSGLFLLVGLFLPLYTFKNYRTNENKLVAISRSLMILAGVVVFWGLMPMSKSSPIHKTHEVHEHMRN